MRNNSIFINRILYILVILSMSNILNAISIKSDDEIYGKPSTIQIEIRNLKKIYKNIIENENEDYDNNQIVSKLKKLLEDIPSIENKSKESLNSDTYLIDNIISTKISFDENIRKVDLDVSDNKGRLLLKKYKNEKEYRRYINSIKLDKENSIGTTVKDISIDGTYSIKIEKEKSKNTIKSTGINSIWAIEYKDTHPEEIDNTNINLRFYEYLYRNKEYDDIILVDKKRFPTKDYGGIIKKAYTCYKTQYKLVEEPTIRWYWWKFIVTSNLVEKAFEVLSECTKTIFKSNIGYANNIDEIHTYKSDSNEINKYRYVVKLSGETEDEHDYISINGEPYSGVLDDKLIQLEEKKDLKIHFYTDNNHYTGNIPEISIYKQRIDYKLINEGKGINYAKIN